MKSLLIAAAGVLVSGAASAASFTVYDTRTGFEAATAGVSVEDFETATGTFNASPLDLGPFTLFQERADGGYFATAGALAPDGTQHAVVFTDSQAVGDEFSFTFDSPITAFGFDVSTRDLGDLAAEADGTPIGFLPVIESSGFWGFTSDMPFTVVNFVQSNAASDGVFIDNVSFGAATGTVPLPPAASLLLLGLGGLAGLRARARR